MILSEEDVKLNDRQIKMLVGGWGKNAYDDTVLKKIIYSSGSGEVSGYLCIPKLQNQKYPLIIWNRGGSGNDGRIDEFIAAGMFGEIASWGYVVLASNYRDKDEFGGKEIEDVMNLMKLSESLRYCEHDRIGMEGWSRGGMMTYLALRMTDKIRCAVIISGLSDLFRNEKESPDRRKLYKELFGNCSAEEFEQRKKERSAVYFADEINQKANILLIHGTSDRVVSYKDSVDIYEKLKNAGINIRLELMEGGDHYLRKYRKEVSVLRKSWFDRYLKA